MADADFASLIAQLAERTAEGKVNWKGTSSESEFVIYFRQFTLSMRRGVDDGDEPFIAFVLRNDAGQKVDEQWVFAGQSGWPDADQMWSRARRRVLKIDEVIEGLISELEAGGEIGDEPTPSADDDFPF